MGSIRPKPKRLAEKLLRIRNALGLSQTDMVRRLGFEGVIWYTQVSAYELGRREPPLMILLEYARAAGVYVDDLIDDEFDLPEKIPGTVRHEGIKRKAGARRKKR
ncbi:MAG TPA: helix-turn-helix transcriptional regulator [Pyrinomonadaceae bacterium]|nr:helix-turn-helix transcriptional regulator [Pyrinomonadaceae bacterium]